MCVCDILCVCVFCVRKKRSWLPIKKKNEEISPNEPIWLAAANTRILLLFCMRVTSLPRGFDRVVALYTAHLWNASFSFWPARSSSILITIETNFEIDFEPISENVHVRRFEHLGLCRFGVFRILSRDGGCAHHLYSEITNSGRNQCPSLLLRLPKSWI